MEEIRESQSGKVKDCRQTPETREMQGRIRNSLCESAKT